MMKRKFTLAALCAGILLSAVAFGGQDIFEAIAAGDLAKVKAIVDADAQVLKAKNNYRQTPLILAVQKRRIEVAEYLLARGADVNAKDSAEATPLSYAIAGGLSDIAKTLIDRNADIESPAMWNMRPLAFALEFKRKDIAEMLIDKGAAVPVEPGQEAYQLFFSACSNGFARLVDRMLEKGFKIADDTNSRGLTQLAAAGGSAAVVETLVRLGFDMGRKNEMGWTPLHAAAEKGHLQAVAALLARGAAIDGRTLSGLSAYDIAASLERTEVAGLLKAKGADVSGRKFPRLEGPYLGQPEPGSEPRMFALDIVSTQDMIHGNVVFAPDGGEAYWSGTYPAAGSDKLPYQIRMMKRTKGVWGPPRLAPFCRIEYGDDCPYITPDGRRVYFLSRRPVKEGGPMAERENVWTAERKGDAWGEPGYLGDEINSLSLHWQVSTDLAGNLYFGGQDPDGKTMGDIFVSRAENGRLLKPEKLGPTVSSADHEHSPFIAPDGSYIVFSRASQRRSQLGLFISFRKKDGGWGDAVCLNEVIGCPTASQCTYVTPDGKYFFYVSWGFGEWAAYWVKADFIDKLRPKA
jgi:ankyrin repeat protein